MKVAADYSNNMQKTLLLYKEVQDEIKEIK